MNDTGSKQPAWPTASFMERASDCIMFLRLNDLLAETEAKKIKLRLLNKANGTKTKPQ